MSANNFQLALDTIAPTGYTISLQGETSPMTFVKNTIKAYFNAPSPEVNGNGNAYYVMAWFDANSTTSTAPATYGNNVSTTYQYEPLRNRLARMRTISPPGDLQDIYYLYELLLH